MTSPSTLAELALEVAEYMPDGEKFASMPRAEWRWMVLEKAVEIAVACNITENSEDLDEVVQKYLSQEEALS